MLNDIVASVASSHLDFPVICDSMYAFAPFRRIHATSSRSQASAPYVDMLWHADIYIVWVLCPVVVLLTRCGAMRLPLSWSSWCARLCPVVGLRLPVGVIRGIGSVSNFWLPCPPIWLLASLLVILRICLFGCLSLRCGGRVFALVSLMFFPADVCFQSQFFVDGFTFPTT